MSTGHARADEIEEGVTMTDKTNYANCIDTRPHAAHPYRSIDRSLKECPGVKNTRYDAAYAQEYRDARRYPVIITME